MIELARTTLFDRIPSLPAQLIFAIIASCALAYSIPYDVLLDRLTQQSPIGRTATMLSAWIIGITVQRANGLSLPVINLRRPVLAIGTMALGVAIWCVVLDGFVFRSALPAGYFAFEQQPLWLRLIYYCTRAFNENVLYRLFLGSLFAWALRSLWPSPKLGFTLSMAGMVVAQLINVAANVSAAGISLECAAWALLRFVLPGTLWAYLYLRHGFTANEGAAMGVHVFLQPMVSFVF